MLLANYMQPKFKSALLPTIRDPSQSSSVVIQSLPIPTCRGTTFYMSACMLTGSSSGSVGVLGLPAKTKSFICQAQAFLTSIRTT